MEFFVDKGLPRESRFELTLSRENQHIVKADSQTGRLVCLCLLFYQIETDVSRKIISRCSLTHMSLHHPHSVNLSISDQAHGTRSHFKYAMFKQRVSDRHRLCATVWRQRGLSLG